MEIKGFHRLILYITFVMIIIISPNVFASDYRLNNHISATSGGTTNRYGGLENYNYGSFGTYTFGTRYQGRLGKIDTYIDYPFEANTTYTLTYNMNTEDFINHFGSSYWWDCSQTMTNQNATVQSVNYISYKKIKFTFRPTANTTCIFVSIRSTNPNSTAITQITNWQLDSIYLYDPDFQGSGGSGGSGGTSTPTPDPNQDIINNNNQNTSDIIENNNQNTQDIINNQNELLGDCIKNLMDDNLILSLENLTQNGNSFTQINADTNPTLVLMAQGYNSSSYYDTLARTDITNTGYYTLSFTKTSSFNVIYYKLNGYSYDTGLKIDVSSLENGKTYYIKSEFTNTSQGTIKFRNLMITEKNIDGFIAWGSQFCTSKLDSTNQAINDVNNSINNDNVDSGVGSSFFSDFDTTDNGGISAIVTKPLMIIDNLLTNNGQCANLTLPEFMGVTTAYLPSGCILWNNATTTMVNLWNIFVCGLGSYFILKDLFRIIENLKNPDNDKVEVMDL